MPRWILVAVDGTGSRSWRDRRGHGNSRIHHFYEDFMCPSPHKQYLDGTGLLGGEETLGVYSSAIEFLGATFRSMLPSLLDYRNSEIFRETVFNRPAPDTDFITQSEISPRFLTARDLIRSSDIKICLMGYSRGGLIAINLARIMPKRIDFLGLYDAVDADTALNGDVIVNVERTFHVRRLIDDNSIVTLYYNPAGTRQTGGAYSQGAYEVNHAEIGSGTYGTTDELRLESGSSQRVAADIAMRRYAQASGVPIRGRYT